MSRKNRFHLVALLLRQAQTRTESRQHLPDCHGRRCGLPADVSYHHQRDGSAAEHAGQENDQAEEGHAPVMQPAEQDHRIVGTVV